MLTRHCGKHFTIYMYLNECFIDEINMLYVSYISAKNKGTRGEAALSSPFTKMVYFQL